MSRASLVILLCGLLPLQALGQATSPPLVPAPDAPVSEQEEPSSEEGTPPPFLSPEEQKARSARMTNEVLLGVLLGAAGAVPGIIMMAGSQLCLASSECSSGSDRFFPGLGLGYVGYLAGVALGVTVGGVGSDGEGGFLAPLGGSLLGGLIGAGTGLGTAVLALLLGIVSEGLGTAVLVVGVPLALLAPPVIGAVMLYESAHASAVKERQRVGVRVMPVLGVSPSGGWVGGLAGRF